VSGEPAVSPGLFVELVVHDTGVGMDKTVIRRMFEPYYTTKETGKGSTFKIYFPAIERQRL